jgi:hypothetical protein
VFDVVFDVPLFACVDVCTLFLLCLQFILFYVVSKFCYFLKCVTCLDVFTCVYMGLHLLLSSFFT